VENEREQKMETPVLASKILKPPRIKAKPLEVSYRHLQRTPHHGSLLKIGIDVVTFLKG
jgi:hypothetical protein